MSKIFEKLIDKTQFNETLNQTISTPLSLKTNKHYQNSSYDRGRCLSAMKFSTIQYHLVLVKRSVKILLI